MELNGPILQISRLTKTFDGVKAIDSLDLEIEEQTITAIIGPNGSGKSTLLNIICGYLKPDKGKVIFRSKDITRLAPFRISTMGVGRTFQMIRVFPQITVMENMLLSLEIKKRENLLYGFNPFSRYDSKELESEAEKLLSIVELKDKTNELAGHLSHGQRRLLEIMRAIALNSDLYLFDEPTAGVFPEVRTKILDILKLLKENGKSIIFVEHNLNIVKKGADIVIVLDKGKILEIGKPKMVFESDLVIKAYFRA